VKRALPAFLLALGACVSADAHLKDALEALDRGREAARHGEHGDAIDLYTSALAANPDLAEAYFERGISAVKLRLRKDEETPAKVLEDRALNDFGMAVQKNPAYADAYFNRAMLRASRGLYKPAVEDLLNASRYRPADPEPHLAVAQIYETKFDDRVVSAMEHYEKYAELGGTDPDAREKVKAWKRFKGSPVSAAGSKPPGPDDEKKAQELHEAFKKLFADGKKAEALQALENLLAGYGQTKYARERAREFAALLAALKR
jgi:tetratricopeptide (TPR) repeat protein